MFSVSYKICEHDVFSVLVCPSLSSWDTRSRVYCRHNPSMYHCLRGATGIIMETCLEPRFIEKGFYPVLSRNMKNLIPIECPASRYQPHGQMSNEFKQVTCSYLKSSCDGIGQEICGQGNHLEDRTCRCDYTKGYRPMMYLLSNPRNSSCFHPTSDGTECLKFPCPKNKELSPVYACVEKNRSSMKELAHSTEMRMSESSIEFVTSRDTTKLMSTVEFNEGMAIIISGMYQLNFI
uniref:Uncharacterized protein LOC111106729 isoform X2 n=1 Tax=Crassostrea virginica TaxID=6565 RepID=A0A8B8B2G4_CRAVI|nr:uncharacterized protein LOC111106729 isoform X2 [Crassostrea virginica]